MQPNTQYVHLFISLSNIPTTYLTGCRPTSASATQAPLSPAPGVKVYYSITLPSKFTQVYAASICEAVKLTILILLYCRSSHTALTGIVKRQVLPARSIPRISALILGSHILIEFNPLPCTLSVTLGIHEMLYQSLAETVARRGRF